MVRPEMRFIATTKDKLDSIVISAGQLIFVYDDRAIYLDVSDFQRTVYQSVITIDSEQDRQAIVFPIDGFYYVKKENTLWSYFNSIWVKIIGESSNIIFIDEEDFPSTGIKNTLYIKDNVIYIWDEDLDEFVKTQGVIGKDKLANEVIASLDKADSAIQSVTEGNTNGTITVDDVEINVHGLNTAAYAKVSDFDSAGAAQDVIGQAGDLPINNTVYGAKAYTDEALSWKTVEQ